MFNGFGIMRKSSVGSPQLANRKKRNGRGKKQDVNKDK
jgi:hypothetical protein